MKTAYLIRNPSTDEGTFGLLFSDNKIWYSLELPDRNNQKNISCIPVGEYECEIRYSSRFRRYTFHLKDVKGRTYILIHSANFAGDINKGWQSHLNGCIALGKKRGSFPNKYGKRQKAVLNSRVAVREFMEHMNLDKFKLIIEEF